jgi:hypothetical protein
VSRRIKMKNKKGESNNPLMILFYALILVLVALALITSVANTKSQQTNLQTIDNKSISVVSSYANETYASSTTNYTIYSQSDWKISECPLTSVGISNGAGTLLVEDTDYTLYENEGVYSLINATKTMPKTSLNKTYVNATYCADGYLTNSGDRNLANLWVTMMVIVLIGALIGVVMKLYKDYKE